MCGCLYVKSMKYLFNLEIYSWLASMVEMQVIYCFGVLACFFGISFTCPVYFLVIEYSLFALSCIFFSLIKYSLIFVPPFGCSAVIYVHWMGGRMVALGSSA
jgi:hypothetical protein